MRLDVAQVFRPGAFRFVIGFFVAALFAASAFGTGITLPPKAMQALDKIYSGDPDAAIAMARDIEQAQPDHPLGYLIESEAKWWKRYCAACEIKYGILEAWKRSKEPDDGDYLALTGKVTTLAEAQLAKSDTAEMRTYAGLGWALQVCLLYTSEFQLWPQRATPASAFVPWK